MDDLLDNLRPLDPIQVPVGRNRTFEVHPLTLAQYVALSKCLKGIDKLPDLVVPVLQAFDTDASKDKSVWTVIREQLPAFWSGARDVLFSQFPQVLVDVAQLALNTPENARLQKVNDEADFDQRTNAFKGNKQIARILEAELTPAQATNVLLATIKMAQVDKMVGKALGLLTPTTPETEESPEEDPAS